MSQNTEKLQKTVFNTQLKRKKTIFEEKAKIIPKISLK